MGWYTFSKQSYSENGIVSGLIGGNVLANLISGFSLCSFTGSDVTMQRWEWLSFGPGYWNIKYYQKQVTIYDVFWRKIEAFSFHRFSSHTQWVISSLRSMKEDSSVCMRWETQRFEFKQLHRSYGYFRMLPTVSYEQSNINIDNLRCFM